jgi:hypothetical protein
LRLALFHGSEKDTELDISMAETNIRPDQTLADHGVEAGATLWAKITDPHSGSVPTTKKHTEINVPTPTHHPESPWKDFQEEFDSSYDATYTSTYKEKYVEMYDAAVLDSPAKVAGLAGQVSGAEMKNPSNMQIEVKIDEKDASSSAEAVSKPKQCWGLLGRRLPHDEAMLANIVIYMIICWASYVTYHTDRDYYSY